MINFSASAITLATAVYLVSGFYLMMHQEETEITTGQKIHWYDRIVCFVPIVNTFFAMWMFILSMSKRNRFN